ncbi:hypothetical protein FSS13T_25790 [Flavobacterium saliperosum S13]|uniref:Uncharacterized protein n=2 Tax=Flavobacterium saliperosum TaxID=329186 RepID=A0A1G4W954_9FLAO|nr:hypothetical protein [Flavobacterium saliperosum]ESU22483.1 hypothetical protein FSS13T_25790 [Flavobacterium saliperosum S13]SCX18784.1 hypothetical protein SAMN02927925_02738 [Flavobacterium saliperosum]
MKKSVIYLGIALLTITNVISALAQQSFIKEESLAQTVTSRTNSVENALDNRSSERRDTNEDREAANGNMEIIAVTAYQKTMEEIIAENNLIIESTILTEQDVEDNQLDISIDASPFTSEKTIEERIQQDSQIIESPILNAVQPISLAKSKKS